MGAVSEETGTGKQLLKLPAIMVVRTTPPLSMVVCSVAHEHARGLGPLLNHLITSAPIYYLKRPP